MLAATLTLLGLAPVKPLMKDFIGLNVHTVLFKPELYRPVASLLRNYHPVSWDTGDDPSVPPPFPKAKNGVDWEAMYKSWNGYRIHDCLMFEEVEAAKWNPKVAATYGETYAKSFGARPGQSVEIGNEPGLVNDQDYRATFQAMATQVRKAAPKALISTCAIRVGKSERYFKSVDCVKGLEPLYDALSIHTYAELEPWPTFKRSYPEDPKVRFYQPVQELIDWRNKNAPGKKVWVTEFGWDATTKPNKPDGDFAKWVGGTDLDQAQYTVRAYLGFASMDVDRAYLYWFNDEDLPQMHGSSGLTRNYKPKMAYHAVAQMMRILGDTRFVRKVRDHQDVKVFEFQGKKKVWVIWSPSNAAPIEVPVSGSGVVSEEMATTTEPPKRERVEGEALASGSPTYIIFP